jgi:hypothetical protein
VRVTTGRLTAVAIGVPIVLASAGLATFSMVGQLARASEHHEATYPWHGGAVSLNTSAGNVRVEIGTGAQVGVSYTEHFQLQRPTISSSASANGVQLNTRCPGGVLGNNCEVNYVLTVPATAVLTLHTGDGAIRVTGGSGADSFDTGNGDILFENVSGDVVAHTGDGGIGGDGVRSKSVHASTGNGGVRIDWSVAPLTVDATTGDGRIALTVPQGAGPYRVSTHTGAGGVHVTVPTDAAATATITAQTGNGGIVIGVAPAS